MRKRYQGTVLCAGQTQTLRLDILSVSLVTMSDMNLKKVIRSVPDFPVEGVMYKDVTSILENPEAFDYSVELIIQYCESNIITDIVAPDARGFLWAAPVARELGIPLHMVRKPGKLPPPVRSKSYDYEYASGTLEMKADAPLNANSNVCIIDDVSATGGTALAIVDLLRTYAVVDMSYACVIDIASLGGTASLDMDTFSVVTYE